MNLWSRLLGETYLTIQFCIYVLVVIIVSWHSLCLFLELQRRCAELFGTEAALFVPTGTMGNLISSRFIDIYLILYICMFACLNPLLFVRVRLLHGESSVQVSYNSAKQPWWRKFCCFSVINSVDSYLTKPWFSHCRIIMY